MRTTVQKFPSYLVLEITGSSDLLKILRPRPPFKSLFVN